MKNGIVDVCVEIQRIEKWESEEEEEKRKEVEEGAASFFHIQLSFAPGRQSALLDLKVFCPLHPMTINSQILGIAHNLL